MAQYALLVQHSPDDYNACENALASAERLLSEDHQLLQVFFYGPAVTFANQYLQFPNGVPDFQQQWCKLANKHQFPLVVCATVGSQYGLEAQPHPDGNLQSGFLAGGLAEFIEVLDNADVLEQFG